MEEKLEKIVKIHNKFTKNFEFEDADFLFNLEEVKYENQNYLYLNSRKDYYINGSINFSYRHSFLMDKNMIPQSFSLLFIKKVTDNSYEISESRENPNKIEVKKNRFIINDKFTLCIDEIYETTNTSRRETCIKKLVDIFEKECKDGKCYSLRNEYSISIVGKSVYKISKRLFPPLMFQYSQDSDSYELINFP